MSQYTGDGTSYPNAPTRDRLFTRWGQLKSEQAMRRVSQQAPDVASIMASAQEGAGGGPSATMLTGPQGIDPSQLSLGRNTLLGS